VTNPAIHGIAQPPQPEAGVNLVPESPASTRLHHQRLKSTCGKANRVPKKIIVAARTLRRWAFEVEPAQSEDEGIDTIDSVQGTQPGEDPFLGDRP